MYTHNYSYNDQTVQVLDWVGPDLVCFTNAVPGWALYITGSLHVDNYNYTSPCYARLVQFINYLFMSSYQWSTVNLELQHVFGPLVSRP